MNYIKSEKAATFLEAVLKVGSVSNYTLALLNTCMMGVAYLKIIHPAADENRCFQP